MKTGERIKNRRKELSITADTVAKSLNISRATIFRYERGESDKIPLEFLKPLAKVLHTTPEYIMGWNDNPDDFKNISNINDIIPIQKHKIPLLGEIACGEPIFAEESFEGYMSCDNIKADFALRCKGDSMINARIFDGDIVFIQRQSIVNNGEIAAIIIDDDSDIKNAYNACELIDSELSNIREQYEI